MFNQETSRDRDKMKGKSNNGASPGTQANFLASQEMLAIKIARHGAEWVRFPTGV